MALVKLFKKKKEETKAPSCRCNGNCVASEATEVISSGGAVSSVKVLGAGCKSCHEQFDNAKKAVKAMGLSAEVEYITDMPKVMEYGVMSMPAIVVNEKVVSQGKVLKAADVEKLLHKLGF